MASLRFNSWISAVALTVVVANWLPVATFAAEPPAASKTIVALLAAAQKQLDAGNFERAAELFLEIWRLDRSTIPALYNAARSFQLAGQLDKSERLFRELLALAELPPAARSKAQTQLDAVQVKRGERRAEDAHRSESAGQFEVAMAMWSEALALDPDRVDYLRRLGRAAQLAHKPQQALAAYAKFLASKVVSEADRSQVQAWRAELTAKQAQTNALDAADADQLAGNLEQAAHRYAAVVADSAQSVETRTKAQERLAHVQRQLALRKADVASRAESEGQFGLAAELWAEAFALDPSQIDWLRRQGRALQVAGRTAAALAIYDRYLQVAPADSTERPQVVHWRRGLLPEAKPAVAVTVAPPSPVVPQLPTVRAAETVSQVGPKVVTTLGLVAAIGGGAVWYFAEAARTKLNSQTWGQIAAKQVPTLTYSQASQQAKDIALRRTLGIATTAAGGGLALLGALAWTLRSDSSAPASGHAVVVPLWLATDDHWVGGVQVAW